MIGTELIGTEQRLRPARHEVGGVRGPDTVNDVRRTLAFTSAVLAMTAAGALLAGTGTATAAAAASAGAAASAATATSAGTAASRRAGSGGATSTARRVVLIGIAGLRWTDVSAAATPALWRLANAGSVGSLLVSWDSTVTCPADGWLTLNAGARAAAPRTAAGSCGALPAVVARTPAASGGTPVAARVPRMTSLTAYNTQLRYNPHWGLLASAAGPGQCATAVGPGAALALASPTGAVSSYLPAASALTRPDLTRCPLTVVDLGALRSAAGAGGSAAGAGGSAAGAGGSAAGAGGSAAGAGGAASAPAASARAAQVSADDRAIGRISAELPPGTILVVAAPADDSAPHLRLIIVSGPGYRSGLIDAASTHQPGLTVITDLTPTVLAWRARPVPSDAVGSRLTRAPRGSLATTIRGLIGRDRAAQVQKATINWFFLIVGFGYTAVFGLIGVLPWGRGENRGRRRRTIARVVGTWAAAVPAGTFLASLVPWWTLGHPAVLLYTMAAGWAAVIATIALTGPWRRDPLGPPGVVAAVTVGVIALDVMTGSRLQLGTPFGLSLLVAGRYYGIGNNAVEIYSASAILCAAWAGSVALRRGSRNRAVLAAGTVLLVAVVAAGWPGFGAKVGGTIAMVPGFLLLLAALAGAAINARRAAIIAVSGLVLISAFALVNYFIPATGQSDIGGFVGQVLHGGAGSILQRKVHSNVGSLTVSMWSLVVPVVIVAGGLAIFWPARFRVGSLVRGYQSIPLLRTILGAIWLVAVLGWFAEDSGVTVVAAELPLVLPLIAVILSSLPPVPYPGGPAKAIFDLPSRFAPRGGIG